MIRFLLLNLLLNGIRSSSSDSDDYLRYDWSLYFPESAKSEVSSLDNASGSSEKEYGCDIITFNSRDYTDPFLQRVLDEYWSISASQRELLGYSSESLNKSEESSEHQTGGLTSDIISAIEAKESSISGILGEEGDFSTEKLPETSDLRNLISMENQVFTFGNTFESTGNCYLPSRQHFDDGFDYTAVNQSDMPSTSASRAPSSNSDSSFSNFHCSEDLCAAHFDRFLSRNGIYRPAITFSEYLNEECSEDAFEVGERIGEGGFGHVFRGVHRQTGEPVALKFAFESSSNKEMFVFLRMEECLQHRLDFPTITRHYCTYITEVQDPGTVVLVTELVDGIDMYELIYAKIDTSETCSGGGVVEVKNHYSSNDVARWSAELVATIRYMHRMSVIFRDLKAENVMVSSEGHIKLVDFGFASDPTKPVHKSTRKLLGTPTYFPPEFCTARVNYASHQADWFALGILLVELSIRTSPYGEVSGFELFDIIPNGFYFSTNDPVFGDLGVVINMLCDDSARRRLGSAPGSDKQFRSLRWFQSTDIDGLLDDAIRRSS